MGFMGTGKSAEDKALEKLATYLENMDLRPKDGMVHAGAFEMAGGYSRKNTSRILNGVLEFMQKQGYEILDVPLSPAIGFGMKVAALPARAAVSWTTYLYFIRSSPACCRVLKR